MKIFTLGLILFCYTGYGQTAIQYFNRGNTKYNQGDYTGAIADYTKAIEIDPKSPSAYNNRGNVKCKLQDYTGAIADYTKAIEIDPKFVEAYFNRGSTKDRLRDIAGAIEDYSKAIEISPDYDEAYWARGRVYNKSFKDFDGKIHGYTDSIENNMNQMKNVEDIENLQYYFNNGNERIPVKKDYIDAMSDFSKVIEINPMNEGAYEDRGEIKYDLKDYRGAIIDFKKAVELNPKDKYAYYYLGFSELLIGQKESGCLDLSKAGELGYEDAYEVIKKCCN